VHGFKAIPLEGRTHREGVSVMNHKILGFCIAVAGMLFIATAFAQSQSQGQGQAIVTVLPKHDGDVAPNVSQQDVQSVKVNGRQATVTAWEFLRSPMNQVELVLLIDGSARSSLGRQMQDIEQFVRSLPPNVKVGIAYMENGRAVFEGPLSADHEIVLRSLHLPGGGSGTNASPYFCLSDLAKNWPAQDSNSRREVLMITDGIDNYQPIFDSEDPYVLAAINDSVRARLAVYSINWTNKGQLESANYQRNAGQSLLAEVTKATGGKSFWQGTGNPVSFKPYFAELTQRLRNQYELGFSAPIGDKPEVGTLKVTLNAPGADIDAPQKVVVFPAGSVLK
jgi:hypothetical protein